MTELEKYELVNKTENLKELADVIRSFGVDGTIQGRTEEFNSERMAIHCENYTFVIHNALTRKYGIRQQAMMLFFYQEMEKIF